MTELLYRWPESARVSPTGRVVPKTKFYENSSVSGSLKVKFVDEIQRITWAFKLSDKTIRLRATSGVPEIQIFSIESKAEDVSPFVLAAIDRAIPKPILFEVYRGEDDDREIRLAAAYKPIGRANPKPTDYVSTGWLGAHTQRVPLPPALDLSGLYDQLIAVLLPAEVGDGETIEAALVRTAEIRRLKRDTSNLEIKMRNEPQFNRKIELRRELAAKNSKLAQLTEPDSPN